MKVGIFGRGRLGSAIAAEIGSLRGASFAQGTEAVELAWVEGREACPRTCADVAIDASGTSAIDEHLEWALSHGVDLVIATTGWSIPDLAARVAACPTGSAGNPDSTSTAGVPAGIGVLVAPNLSPGAALMRRMAALMGEFAEAEPGSEISISEWHHHGKVDSPSGTAKSLAEAVRDVCPRYTGWNSGAWRGDSINITSLRSGFEIGRHELILDSPFETLTIMHEVRDRRAFASGALRAALWLRGRKGVFTMDDFAATFAVGGGRESCQGGI